KRTLANKPLLTSSASILVAAFRISAAVPRLDSSVVNSSLWQMHRDGQVKRAGECRSYRYTLIDTTAVTESDPSVQYRQRPGGVNPMTNLFNQCLAGVRK
ncbi:hypothetical protein RAF34_29775, partial [Klebsiella pneumoniae]